MSKPQMKTLILVLSLLTLACSMRRTPNRKIFIPAIGWSFSVSDKISFIDSSFNNKGDLTEEIPDDGKSLRLFVTKSEKGFLGAYIKKDTLSPQEWKDYIDEDTDLYFNQMRQLPQMVVLNTKYTSERVGNTEFRVQYVKHIMKRTNDTGHIFHYFAQLRDKSIDISFSYSDKELGKLFHEILNSSNFSY